MIRSFAVIMTALLTALTMSGCNTDNGGITVAGIQFKAPNPPPPSRYFKVLSKHVTVGKPFVARVEIDAEEWSGPLHASALSPTGDLLSGEAPAKDYLEWGPFNFTEVPADKTMVLKVRGSKSGEKVRQEVVLEFDGPATSSTPATASTPASPSASPSTAPTPPTNGGFTTKNVAASDD